MKSSKTVFGLIVANAILFVATYFIQGGKFHLIEGLALFFPENDRFRIWQFVTSMFIHGGPAHLLFNMYALFSFGSILERIWGPTRFITFYFLAGIGAGLIYAGEHYIQYEAIFSQLVASGIAPHNIVAALKSLNISSPEFANLSHSDTNTLFEVYYSSAVGASGAIYGVLAAFGVIYPNAKLSLLFIPVPVAAKYFIPALVGLDLFSGVTGFSLFGGGIAHFAHIGGALIGFALTFLWRRKDDPIQF